MTATTRMEAAIRGKLTRRRQRTFHPLLNSLVQGKGGLLSSRDYHVPSFLPFFFSTSFFLSLVFPLQPPLARAALSIPIGRAGVRRRSDRGRMAVLAADETIKRTYRAANTAKVCSALPRILGRWGR
jgi:hypothetical protein